MNRCIVNVATGPYVRGWRRLFESWPLQGYGVTLNGDTYSNNSECHFMYWCDALPDGSPSHAEIPYAFKAHAIAEAGRRGAELVLWADASILPIASLDPLWEKIEREGAWISRNGYRNSEWTAESAYADLGVTREENDNIEHVVATTFGLNLSHEKGRYIFGEYLRLAKTKAFCGPWTGGIGVQHRHDQTALSVIAWRAGVELTNPPEWFAYRGGETEKTVLVADGNY